MHLSFSMPRVEWLRLVDCIRWQLHHCFIVSRISSSCEWLPLNVFASIVQASLLGFGFSARAFRVENYDFGFWKASISRAAHVRADFFASSISWRISIDLIKLTCVISCMQKLFEFWTRQEIISSQWAIFLFAEFCRENRNLWST